MNFNVIIPDIGDDEFEITDILIQIGDQVNIDQSIITIEGNKSLIEIPSPKSGIVKEIKVAIGDKVKTGSFIMIFDDVSDKISLLNNQQKNLQESICETINQTNNKIKENDKIYDPNQQYAHATPVVRRLARKFDIDLSKIKGKGRKGRILKDCLYNYIREAIQDFKSKSLNIQKKNNNTFNRYDEHSSIYTNECQQDIKQLELSSIQKISGANLSRNWTTIPHVTLFDQIDITDLEDFRKQQNIRLEKKNINTKITLLAFIVKTVTYALQEMPRFNSSISNNLNKIIINNFINIGIAVDTPNGLLVPVLKNTNKKNIIELSKEIIVFSKKATEGKLTTEHMKHGSFTISSLGNIGTTYFTPIINAPEVAILGISKHVVQPIWFNKKFIPRLILPISLSFDHRVIDGADAARFINLLSYILSDIRNLII
ncbi:MAG: dihydrolipoamide acetyltransferase [Pantoea sp. Brub]|nr:dihydrolipoamide acetyltransferase [Pantoea sp. Brub]